MYDITDTCYDMVANRSLLGLVCVKAFCEELELQNSVVEFCNSTFYSRPMDWVVLLWTSGYCLDNVIITYNPY